MADVAIGFRVDTGAGAAKIEDFAKKGTSALNKLGSKGASALKRLSGGIKGAFKSLFSFKGLLLSVASGAAMKRFIDRSNEQEEASAQLAQALGHSSEALETYASSLQKTTTFGDEAIIGAEALIAAFVKDEDQIKAATAVTLDLAAAKGMDLTAAADLVSKTLGSSTNALSRYGIEVEGAVGSQERLNSLVENVTDKFGGQAETLRKTDSGGLKSLGNAIGDVEEGLGDMLKTILGPLAQQATPALIDLSEEVKAFVKSDEFRSRAESFAATITDMISGFKTLAGWVVWGGEKFVAFGETLGETAAKIVIFEEKAIAKIKAFPGEVFASGKALVDEFVRGIEERASASYDAVAGWLKGIRDYLPFSPAKTGPLSDLDKSGEAIPATLAKGVTANREVFISAVSEMAAGVNSALSEASAPAIISSGELPSEFTDLIDQQQNILDIKEFYAGQALEALQTSADSEAEIARLKNAEILAIEEQTNQMRITAALATSGTLADAMQALFVATGSQNKELFAAYKVFAVSEAMISAYLAASKALAEVPYPFNFAAAAAVFAAGAANAAAIASQEMTGTVSSTSISSGGTEITTGETTTASVDTSSSSSSDSTPVSVSVQIFNPMGNEDWDALAEEEIVPALQRALGRNLSITVNS